jgi:STE24 endopeptidase
MFAKIIITLFAARFIAQLGLSILNQRHVQKHAGQIPEPFRGMVDDATYARSVDYTITKERFGRLQDAWATAITLIALFSGFLPWAFTLFSSHFGQSIWSMAAWLFAVGVCLAVPDLPLDWFAQFKIEARFGFNTTSLGLWCVDRIKGLFLALVIGYPLLGLILKLATWSGDRWWLWAWACLMMFQLIMFLVAPVVILPLFNKFEPLPPGTLRDRLLNLAGRTNFSARSIQVMDGSKRSRHSNAFFTGFGQFRKIVLFDTLITQLAEIELEAVLAHEIGHYKKRHIPKTLAMSAGGSFLGFYVLAVLAREPWFLGTFGFSAHPGNIAPALLLFALLSGLVTFWFSPLAHWWSRRNEYEADGFAAAVMKQAAPLITALRKLNEKNLSNLTPHPIHSGFYYSHPTLLEREQVLRAWRASAP